MAKPYTDPRLGDLNGEMVSLPKNKRLLLTAVMEPHEIARSAYMVRGHMGETAILTDRSLIFLKGMTSPTAVRIPFPLIVMRGTHGFSQKVTLLTSLGQRTLSGSRSDRLGLDLLKAAGATLPGITPFQERLAAQGARVNAEVGIAEPTRVAAPLPAASPDLDPSTFHPEPHSAAQTLRRATSRKPRKPRRRRARKPWVGFAPPSQIWEMASNCIKCGRPLSNPRSMRARVGTTCIKRYGPQPRKIPNPAHQMWLARKTKAQVEQIAKQAAYDAEFNRARKAYDEALENWTRARRSA